MRISRCVKCVKMCVITHFTRVCKKRCVILPLKGEKNYTPSLLTHDRVGANNLHTTQLHATRISTLGNLCLVSDMFTVGIIFLPPPPQGIFCLVE
jgi:hypothetical protein